jgi:hypothetical protein
VRASITARASRTLLIAAVLAAGGLTAPAAMAGVASTTPVGAAAASGTVDVTVNADEGLGTIPATAYGLNSAVWDSQMNVPQVQDLLQQAGVRMLRYPGGSYGDIYNWQTNTATGGYVAPGTDFDSFMGTVQKVGAQPILIANYGSGTPQEAAAWVQYANVTKGYGVKYWEIGNEIYGNGYYGADWETDNHSSKSPATYAANVLQYASAMKAVDPAIKIGAVLTLPGNWPDSVVASGDSGDWNQQVLAKAGSAIDFVIVHFYPSSSLGATVLTAPEQLAGELAQLRQEIHQYAGANAPNRPRERRVHRRLLGHPQRSYQHLHCAGRRDRLRGRRRAVQRPVPGQRLRAGAEYAVPLLLRDLHAQQAGPARRHDDRRGHRPAAGDRARGAQRQRRPERHAGQPGSFERLPGEPELCRVHPSGCHPDGVHLR